MSSLGGGDYPGSIHGTGGPTNGGPVFILLLILMGILSLGMLVFG